MKTFLIFTKKWGKYIIIILVALFVLAYFIFFKKDDETNNVEISDKLQKGLKEVKEKLEEASNQAVVETIIAKKEHIETKKQLNEISKIKDKNERRSKLADLAKRNDVIY